MELIPVFKYMDVEECAGCELCENICPFNAITMIPDREGFLYPAFTEKNCRDCGRCVKECPVLHTRTMNDRLEDTAYYAGYAMEDSIVKSSSSGGFWTLLVEGFFQRNASGRFFASVWNDDFKGVHYDYADSMSEIERFRKSKYTQSRKGDIFCKVKQSLESGIPVLFTGTPCEVSALKQFIGNKFENLYTIDLVCQGPLSPKAFQQFVECMEKRYHSKVVKISLREVGGKQWIPQWIQIMFENGKQYYRPFYDTELGEALHTMQRLSCYKCKFTGEYHASDITIGDYHGAEQTASYYNKYGTSIAAVNTQRGYEWFMSATKEKAVITKTSLEQLRKTNPRLAGTWNESLKRKRFSNVFCETDVFKAAHAVWSRKQNLLFRMPWKIRLILEKFI